MEQVFKPVDDVLLDAIRSIKSEFPDMGAQRVAQKLHEMQPNWCVNQKRVRRLIREANPVGDDGGCETGGGCAPPATVSPAAARPLGASRMSASLLERGCAGGADDDGFELVDKAEAAGMACDQAARDNCIIC